MGVGKINFQTDHMKNMPKEEDNEDEVGEQYSNHNRNKSAYRSLTKEMGKLEGYTEK